MILSKQELKELFDIINLEEDLNPILSLLSELCKIPDVFVSLIGTKENIVKAKIGCNLLTIPEHVLMFNEAIIKNNKVFISSKSDMEKVPKTNDYLRFPFDFFAGFPICIDKNVVVGKLCIMDLKPKELTPEQLKVLELTVLQIQSVLNLHIRNKKLQIKEKQNERKIRLFEDNSKEILFEINIDGFITNASDSWTRFLGYKLSDVIGKSYAAFIHPEDVENFTLFFQNLRHREQKEGEIIYRILHQNGDYAWHISCVKLLEKDGIQFYEGSCRDINEHIEVQQKLLKQKEFYERILDRLPTDIAVFDQNFKYLYVNPAAIKNDELRKFVIGKDDFEYAEYTGNDAVFAKNRQVKFMLALETRNLIEWEDSIQSPNGETTYYTRIFAPVLFEGGTLEMMVSIGVDITERKKIEDENKFLLEENTRNKTIQLDEAKNMYRLLADNTIDLVCLHHLDGSFSYVSPSIQKLLGYFPEELTGRFPEEFVHPEDKETLKNSLKVIVRMQENAVLQIRFRNKDGLYIWFETKAILVIENEIPIRFQSSTRDITQRKKTEEIIENTLIQERELNELRTNLVSTISHEFRTPMTTIRTSAELISIYLEGFNFQNDSQINKRVDIITGEIDRIIELMNAVLTISKEDAGKTNFNPVLFNLKQFCLDVIDSSYVNYDSQRKVITSFLGDNFTIFADKMLMEYCIFNVLNNAFKYSKGCGDILLNVFSIHDNVFIEIIDFGIGIPEKDQPQLFKTFFRASNTEGVQGTGLGLYIVNTFAKKNFGSVALESQLGKGTKVTLKFPLEIE